MTSNEQTVVVVGLGEVGRPLFDLVKEHHPTLGVDIDPPAHLPDRVGVMHVCFPFQIPDFVGETARYIERFRPALTVVNSTVEVGTTRAIGDRTGAPVAYSPVRGKHANMSSDLRRYVKFIGAPEEAAARAAAAHFESVGLRTCILSSPETTEVAKLSETTFFGLMIAWAQEVERYADKLGADYEEIVSFYDEIGFFPPVRYFPGVIGGHCVMPNIELLGRLGSSVILDAVKSSNQLKVEREARQRTGVPVTSD
jgi:UDP-N-acetyl-D-mannosaminuronate dehydrogenase